jgi:hypothetical protein
MCHFRGCDGYSVLVRDPARMQSHWMLTSINRARVDLNTGLIKDVLCPHNNQVASTDTLRINLISPLECILTSWA